MRRSLRAFLAAALPLLGAAACDSFLNADEAQTDPNRQTVASLNQRFVGVQATQFLAQTGTDARTFAIFTQQLSGTDRQYQSLALYDFGEDAFSFSTIYGGGGLVDLRSIQTDAAALGDDLYVGIAQVLEALVIGTAASIFGDIPYSEAVSDVTSPALDPQLEVYDALQALLDEAIVNIAGDGSGPLGADLVYGGSRTKWTELAYTLKARFFMHTAEVRGAPAYQGALAAAAKGISTPANDYKAMFNAVPGEENPFYQFIEVQRSGYLSSSSFLIDLLRNRNDPRLTEYFEQGDTTLFVGADQGQAASGVFATLSETRGDAGFDQPIVTHAENLLIWAEAAYFTSNEAVALQKLNAARALDGLPPVALTGRALIEEILTEKYIQLFQNIEVYNDYKRTCFPNLDPAGTNTSIPARPFYPLEERQTNPNILPADEQPTRNANDPPGGTVNNAAVCLGS